MAERDTLHVFYIGHDVFQQVMKNKGRNIGNQLTMICKKITYLIPCAEFVILATSSSMAK